MSELAKSFDPAVIEARWAPLWEQSGVYEPTLDPARPSFAIQLPPPNVTGTLHMGHAFNQTATLESGRVYTLFLLGNFTQAPNTGILFPDR